jgi:glycosyltransferase involved in cell wall biosynthesis
MERDLAFDPLFFRHAALIEQTLRAFAPDVIHITGPSELGIFGAYFAWRLGIPLAASWHTNVHEYAARRIARFVKVFGSFGVELESGVEQGSLSATAAFYKLAKVLYAPNPELCALLTARTGRPCFLMQRGVETDIFTPAKRTRGDDGRLVLGFVGRLSVEKNVALLPRIDAALRERGRTPEWLIVGHGDERATLEAALPAARFTGVLAGDALAAAYADMDVFVFPSHTDKRWRAACLRW